MALRVKEQKSRVKFGGGCLSAAAGFILSAAILSADVANIGLTNRYVDVVLQNISMGRTYQIGQINSQKFSVTNQGKTVLSLNVEKQIPDISFLKPGYRPIPDTSWLKVSPSRFRLKPGETMSGRVTLRVPRDDRWKGQHFQAALWTHSDEGPMAVGIRSYVRFSVEAEKPAVSDVSARDFNLKLVVSPGSRMAVAAGKKSEIGTVMVRNENERAVRIRLRSVRPMGDILSSAMATPNPEFLQLSSEIIDVPAGGSKEIAMFADVPAGAHFGKTYAFSIRADELNNPRSIFTDLYLHIKK